jgi:hypothetical protein
MRVLLAIAGLGLIGYGVYGWLDAPGHELQGRLIFAAAALVAHDFVVVPLVVLAGLLTARFVPRVARQPVQAALVVGAVLTAVALPFVIGAGRIADNPSAFPQQYTRGLLILLAVALLVAAGWTLARARKKR